MRIALAIDEFYLRRGGAEQSLLKILRALHERGHILDLVSKGWDEPLPVPMTGHPVAVARHPRWRHDHLFAKRSAAVLSQLSPDLVLGVRNTLVMDVLLARGGLYCENWRANQRANLSPLRHLAHRLLPKHRVLLNLERRVLGGERPPLVVAPSAMVKEHVQRNFHLPDDRVVVVRTGVDLDRFRPVDPAAREALRQSLGWPARVTALFIAHNFRLKGLDCLLDAWRRVDPARFHLVIAGRNQPPRELGRYANIQFVGECADPRPLYQAADVLVHPTFYDPFSRVVIEALACGLPVITTRRNGAAEILTDGREGFLMDEPTEIERLAELIARFGDATLAQRCGIAARQLAEQYPEAQFLEQTVAAIEEEARKRMGVEPTKP